MTPLYLIFLSASLFFTALILHFLIPALKSRKMGQKILEIGPRWHKSKEGTPTMAAFPSSSSSGSSSFSFSWP